jgi:hypothetical protein
MVVGRFHWTVAPSPRRNPHKHSDLATHSPNGSKRPALARGGVAPVRRDSSRGQVCHRSGLDESQEPYAAGPRVPRRVCHVPSARPALARASGSARTRLLICAAVSAGSGPGGSSGPRLRGPVRSPKGAIPGRAPAKGGGGRSVRQPSHWPLPMTATITGTVTDIAHARRLSRILRCPLTSSD